ncbi:MULTISPECIES: DUF6114 domain-containing protein [unclassified Streptomyces]|uniref:DUF6114 domain-containing protein n=1 Tax=unclassified Streptomyces TaxID=2593676 RepID=UPI00226E41BE|nr:MULTISPECIES: DUF6114 domain-containing protein [unclassified Streptomyces]MCY0917250.1 DUF6114 domain-containing protein [Streptomyces sp. H27-G5]MCY0957564.1 DUF6114 domain-containing protein [Streptomyces sp. H27-H5]
MNAEAPVRSADEHWLTVVRHRFRDWRGQRPFWAGLFILFGGFPIAYFPYADLRLGNVTLAMATTAGAGSLIIGLLLMTLGVALWFQQSMRVFAGVASILLALVSLPVSNLGGFFIGFLFSLLGGALALSWAPGKPADPEEVDATDKGAALADGPYLAVPGPRDTETAYATETTAHADGGRNSAG